jgi:hypothetical protein
MRARAGGGSREDLRKWSMRRSCPPCRSRRSSCKEKNLCTDVHIKIDCDSDGKAVVDEDEVVVVDDDL